jgi:hypothetical protein
MKTIVVYLAGHARDRRAQELPYKPFGLELAQQTDPKLAVLMQNIEDAKKALDDYVLARVEK